MILSLSRMVLSSLSSVWWSGGNSRGGNVDSGFTVANVEGKLSEISAIKDK